uniref:Uncharacterized protein n=1 Tax=Anguilla anguilla TaxID=7936 RepID=A0A0E9PMF0_ANGAN
MMNDYSAASPRIFPHTCSLCNVECVQIKVSICLTSVSYQIIGLGFESACLFSCL